MKILKVYHIETAIAQKNTVNPLATASTTPQSRKLTPNPAIKRLALHGNGRNSLINLLKERSLKSTKSEIKSAVRTMALHETGRIYYIIITRRLRFECLTFDKSCNQRIQQRRSGCVI